MERARLFSRGRRQAVLLPDAMRFDCSEVYVTRVGNALILLPSDDPWGPLRESLGAFSRDYMASREQPSLEQRKGLD